MMLSDVQSAGPILLLTMAEYFAKNRLNISLEYVTFIPAQSRILGFTFSRIVL